MSALSTTLCCRGQKNGLACFMADGAFDGERVPIRRVSHNQTVDSKTLLTEALRLSPEERAALAGELILSLETDVDQDAEAAWSDEIRARLAELDGGGAQTASWSQARRRIHAAAGPGPRS